MSANDLPGSHDYPPRTHHPAAHSPGRPLLYLLLLAFGIGVGAVGLGVGERLWHNAHQPPVTDPEAKPKEAVANGPLDPYEAEGNTIYEAAKPSVVNVDTVVVQRDQFADKLLEHQTGTGSGFVWDTDGRIVTNFHVVQGATRRGNGTTLRVVTADRTEYPARIVGTSPDHDLAVIQITAPKDRLHPIEVASSADLKVGQKAFAIGNPFGLSESFTRGIVSSLDRTIEAPSGASITGAVQHSAAINPGNSGGPLLNRFGKLVGVNTAIPATAGGGNVGIGFAIPSDTVNQVVTQIIRTGRTYKPDLGVQLYDERRLRAAGFDRGVMIAQVTPGGPADRANLRGIRRDTRTGRAEPGDIIVAVNGEDIPDAATFQKAVAKLKTGDKVTVRFLRGDEEQEATLTVQGV